MNGNYRSRAQQNSIQFKFLFAVGRNGKPQKFITLCLGAFVCHVKVSKSHSIGCRLPVISIRNTECSDVVSKLKGTPNIVVVLLLPFLSLLPSFCELFLRVL
jgi:hypothetical protein